MSPEAFTGLKTGGESGSAAGLPAVLMSAKHVFSVMGLQRGMKALLNLNQKGGIDCPGCAWPDPDDKRSPVAEYCENGAKAIAEESTTRITGPEFFSANSISQLAKLSDYELGKSGRIAQPMYLPEGKQHYEEISWDEAFKVIAEELQGLASPDEAIFYTSGRTSNEAAFLYQLFVREYGTNNMPDCSNMCHESTGLALSETLGIGKGSVKLEDFYETEVIVIMGQNPGTNHPRMLTALQKAKRNGAIIISVNPLFETGLRAFKNPQEIRGLLGMSTDLTDHYLQVRINGDMALLQAMAKVLLEEEEAHPGKVLDHQFIKEKTEGSSEYLQHLSTLSMDALVENCGIAEEKIREVVNAIRFKNKMIICWAMGLTQHKNSVDTIKEVVNLLLLKGSIGKPGAGTCPVRGHSNVQGDRTMGIYEKPSDTLLDNLEKVFGISPPREYGYDTVKSIAAMHQGKAKFFMGMGGNFLSATPDTHYTAEAMRKCNLTVHVSTKLNRSHLVHGKKALILPTLGRSDVDYKNGQQQFVSVENSTGVVHSSQGKLKPVSDKLLSEPEIICRMAQAVLPGSKINWGHFIVNYDHIRDAIEKCVPGFDDYNRRVRRGRGFYLPNCAREGDFDTDSGKANFTVSEISPIPLEKEEYLMMTIRSHDQYNTTIYGLNDRYRGIRNERRVVLMNREDMEEAGLENKTVVNLYNNHGGRSRIAHNFIALAYDIPRRMIATYFPEANVLVPHNSTAKYSNCPTSKSVVVRIQASAKQHQA
ncbi:FdhF/YdeP family oxidoreductase [Zeaxanthinibacter enoshimensis]|uniref:FdhF/YdeP family oxidoreductase n=1 Tax=Zeaxanthinibacter enoshimensis TaxID=392009 RepID=UPI003563D53E